MNQASVIVPYPIGKSLLWIFAHCIGAWIAGELAYLVAGAEPLGYVAGPIVTAGVLVSGGMWARSRQRRLIETCLFVFAGFSIIIWGCSAGVAMWTSI